MEAFKCDRCGKYFDKIPELIRNGWREDVDDFTVSLAIARHGDPSDLCPSCIDALSREAIKQRENLTKLLLK